MSGISISVETFSWYVKVVSDFFQTQFLKKFFCDFMFTFSNKKIYVSFFYDKCFMNFYYVFFITLQYKELIQHFFFLEIKFRQFL